MFDFLYANSILSNQMKENYASKMFLFFPVARLSWLIENWVCQCCVFSGVAEVFARGHSVSFSPQRNKRLKRKLIIFLK